MFTGIIEEIGQITKLDKERDNLKLTVATPMAKDLKIDQSLAHNGVCLTVVEQSATHYVTTAVAETLERSNLSTLKVGDKVNLERARKIGDRLDGHMVQGHVDQTGVCTVVEEKEGSHIFHFQYDISKENVTIEKGSITVNGISLTVVESRKGQFSVAVIPYTYAHTTLKNLTRGEEVNLEFDIVGKYVKRLLKETEESKRYGH